MKIKIKREYILSIIAVFFGLIAGALLMFVTGNNPFQGFSYLFRGGLMNIERIGNTIAASTPLIFSGLSVAFAFKTGLFNIGSAGQMLMGGVTASFIALNFNLPKMVLLPIMFVGAVVSGGLWGSVSGFLKAKFNVHEVVSTIMLNWIAYWTVYYVVPLYMKGAFLETESRRIPVAGSLKVDWLGKLFDGSYINLGIFLAIIFTVIIAFVLDKTTLGYELKAVGFNRTAAETAGIDVNRNIILSMAISGALAGIGGLTLYTGIASNIQIGVLPSQGFDGIAVSLLGANSPLGVFVSALFFGLLHSGKGFMTAVTGIPPEIADTIIATIIYFAATSIVIDKFLENRKKKREEN